MTRIDPATADLIDIAGFEDTAYKEDMTLLPREFNVPIEEEHLRRTEVCCLDRSAISKLSI